MGPRALLAGLLVVLLGASRAGARPEAATGGPSRPRLVVFIVVDQLRYDFLERFSDLFGAGGFRRLVGEGAFFENAHFEHAPTYTATGHAALFTGSFPAEDGIVANGWFDRELGRVRGAVADPSARLVSNGGLASETGASSPRALLGPTLGDQLRLATRMASKVVAVSFKDRSAILPGGLRPSAAYWFNTVAGMFVSSDYYLPQLPPWAVRFNETRRPDRFFGARWELALPEEAYRRAQAETLPVQGSALGDTFPHLVTGGEAKPGELFYRAFELTPFASEHLAEFAAAAIDGEAMGADDDADLLTISFSAPDLIGHAYGPDSREAEDTYVRLDRTLANLLREIDRRVGLDRTVVALTGDHGVMPVPELLTSLGFESVRISPREVSDVVNHALVARFGGEKWVAAFLNDQVYLDLKVLAERKVDPAVAERVAGEAALGIRGVASYLTRSQILDGRLPPGPFARRMANGFHPTRSGDVWILTRPFAMVADTGVATGHGSPYAYDAHVPVILFGPPIRPGRYRRDCSPTDIVPTLASILGIERPAQAVGRVLDEALY